MPQHRIHIIQVPSLELEIAILVHDDLWRFKVEFEIRGGVGDASVEEPGFAHSAEFDLAGFAGIFGLVDGFEEGVFDAVFLVGDVAFDFGAEGGHHVGEVAAGGFVALVVVDDVGPDVVVGADVGVPFGG